MSEGKGHTRKVDASAARQSGMVTRVESVSQGASFNAVSESHGSTEAGGW